jgi:hypothetical protein
MAARTRAGGATPPPPPTCALLTRYRHHFSPLLPVASCCRQGAEYTLLGRLALSGALCSVDTIMLEWHLRYFYASESGKVSRGMNLSAGTSGGAPVFDWALNAPQGIAKAAAACTNTSLVAIDDESYLHDTRPWPARTRNFCAASAASPIAGRGTANRSSALLDPSLSLERSHTLFARVARVYHSVHDEMEDDQLLWLWHALLGMLLLGFICCCWSCYDCWVNEDEDAYLPR